MFGSLLLLRFQMFSYAFFLSSNSRFAVSFFSRKYSSTVLYGFFCSSSPARNIFSSSAVTSTPKTSDNTTGVAQDINEDEIQTIRMMKIRIGRNGANAMASRQPQPALFACISSSVGWFFFPPMRLRRNRIMRRFNRSPPF